MSETATPILPIQPPNAAGTALQSSDAFWLAAYTSLLLVFWTIAVGISFWFAMTLAYKRAEVTAQAEAALVFEKDFAVTQNPFAPGATADTPPTGSSPQAQPHRTRNHGAGIIARIIFLNPSGLAKLDPWENLTLPRFLHSEKEELAEMVYLQGEPHLRFLRRLPAAQTCLSCHVDPKKEFMDKVGDGAISLAVPMEPLWEGSRQNVNFLAFIHIVLWLMGLLTFGLSGRGMLHRAKERDKAEAELRTLTRELENRVIERTKEVMLRQRTLQTFMDNTDAGVYLKNTDLEFILANRQFALLIGEEEQTFIGTDRMDFIDNLRQRESILAHEREVMETRKGKELEVELYIGGEKQARAFSVITFPIANEEGLLEGIGGILLDISQRKTMEEALRAARDQAETASRAKSDFLANISHEIRTPLNGVIGMTELLLLTRLNQDQASIAGIIKSAGDNLLSVLNDILDFSKIEAGKIQLESLPFSLRELLFTTFKALCPVAAKKGVELLIRIPPHLPDQLLGDVTRLRQILLNLVSNAIKFTEQGEVIVKVSALDNQDNEHALRFEVIDTGIGMSPHVRNHIFSAFQQADTSTTRKYGGTGLGLAIASRLARLMGSDILVKSALNQGSSFWFDLPLPRLAEHEPPQDQEAAAPLAGKKVLLVYANTAGRQVVKEQMTDWNLEIQECADPSEAASLILTASLQSRPFDLAILDLPAHRPNAVEQAETLIAALRQAAKPRPLPLILLVAVPLALAPEQPVQARLSKPARPEELLQALRLALDMKSLEKENLPNQADEDRLAQAKPRTCPSLRILLVEDMEMNRLVATRMLEMLGHTLRVACNGLEALPLLAQEPFDLVFMDIQMPLLDGVQTVRRIRAAEEEDGNERHIPVVAMTAHALKGDREKYLAAGMDGYIAKPLLRDKLEALILEMVERFNLAADNNPESAVPASQHLATQPLGKSSETIAEPTTPAPTMPDTASPPAMPIASLIASLQPLLDEAVMTQIFGGDIGFIRESMSFYLRDAPRLAEEILAAIHNEDNAALKQAAHSLKGMSGYYNRAAFYERCLQLEQIGRDQHLPAAKAEALERFTELSAGLREMLRIMEARLSRREES